MPLLPPRTTFGDPHTIGEVAELLTLPSRQARLVALGDARRVLTEIDRRLRADSALFMRAGRWRPGQPDPDTFVPGDIVALRHLVTEAHIRDLHLTALASPAAFAMRLTTDPSAWSVLHDTYWAVTATPYFLPVTDAISVMASHPPTAADLADLRLPFPAVSIYFAADLAFDPHQLRWPAALDDPARSATTRSQASSETIALPRLETLDPRAAADLLNRFRLSPEAYQELAKAVTESRPRSWQDPVWGLRHLGGYLTGVTLFAGPDGTGLADDVLWTIACNPDPDAPPPMHLDRVRALVAGRLSRSTLQPLAEILAAAVAWGAWRTPDATVDLPGEPGSATWLKATRKGAFRRQERSGALAGVRVLDVAALTAQAAALPQGQQDGRRQSPGTHLRRGHIRRVRVGPRTEYRIRRVWIPPTVVNPGHPGIPMMTVRRLPVPDPSRLPAPARAQPASPPTSGSLPEAMRRTATRPPLAGPVDLDHHSRGL